MYNSLPALVLKVLDEKGEKEIVGKKSSVSTSLDYEFEIAMHWPFPRAFKVALKVCSSILCV
jgi:hypothetical protein